MKSNSCLNLSENNEYLRTQLLPSRGADYSTANQLAHLCETYNVKWAWITVNGVAQVMFAGNQLAEAKGLERNAFQQFVDAKYAARRFRASSQDVYTEGVVDKINKDTRFNKIAILKGAALKEFKSNWLLYWGEALGGRSNKLLVCDWSICYQFICQGFTEAATDFSALGSDLIVKTIENESTSNETLPVLVSERELQKLLILAAGYSDIKLRCEAAYLRIEDNLKQGYESKFVDLIEKTPGQIFIYELKKDLIKSQHIYETLNGSPDGSVIGRNYLELVGSQYPRTKKFTVVMCAPNGIDLQAQSFLFDTYLPFGDRGQSYKLVYKSFGSILARLLNNALESTPVLCRWFLQREWSYLPFVNYLNPAEVNALLTPLSEEQREIECLAAGVTKFIPYKRTLEEAVR